MDLCHDPLVRSRWFRRAVLNELRRLCRADLDQIILLHVDDIGECCRIQPWPESVALLQYELQQDGDHQLVLLCTETIPLDGAA